MGSSVDVLRNQRTQCRGGGKVCVEMRVHGMVCSVN